MLEGGVFVVALEGAVGLVLAEEGAGLEGWRGEDEAGAVNERGTPTPTLTVVVTTGRVM